MSGEAFSWEAEAASPHDGGSEVTASGRVAEDSLIPRAASRHDGGPEATASERAAEDSLVARARAGDRDAFEALVALHLPRVWRVVWRILRHREDCEDVAQDVFLAAWQALPGYRGEARFSTWLHTIAVTRSLNHLGRAAEKVRRASTPLEALSPDGPTAELALAVEAAGPRSISPLQSLESEELMRRLAECLERLPATWRAVLSLRDGEELSYDEMARALGIALGTVRSRLARARLSLRHCVEGHA